MARRVYIMKSKFSRLLNERNKKCKTKKIGKKARQAGVGVEGGAEAATADDGDSPATQPFNSNLTTQGIQ